MKKNILLLLSIICLSCFANARADCPQALSTSDPDFCSSFKAAAICHCTSKHLPSGLCQDMSALYSRMISMFGSLDRACSFQKDTSKQTCIDDWNCYLNGGEDSQGRLCSGTGASC